MSFDINNFSWLTIISLLMYSLGFVCAISALWRSRTPQGATAWVVGLISFPFLVVPLFIIFGRNKFFGYIEHKKGLNKRVQNEIRKAKGLLDEQAIANSELFPLNKLALRTQQIGFTGFNKAELLIDGEKTYESILESIRKAKKYILFQFYIFRIDNSGITFAELLIKKSREGVKVYFLYDQIGTNINSSFLERLDSAGILVGIFESTKRWSRNLQINFRNHRKVVVIDGMEAFIGGHNIGDEYLGHCPEIGAWRDTHIKLIGPSALAVQDSFVRDWYWAKEVILDLEWIPKKIENGLNILVLQTSAADTDEACLLAYLNLINSAKRRIWIANPYIVPPDSIINGLALAVLRGVEVKIISPSHTDNVWIKLASRVFTESLVKKGVKVYKYMPGVLHQKVMLIDNDISVIGSNNLDSRSFFINFEIMAIILDKFIGQQMELVLTQDLRNSQELTIDYFSKKSTLAKLSSRAISLMSPIL